MPRKPTKSGKVTKSSTTTKSGKASESTPAAGYPGTGSDAFFKLSQGVGPFETRPPFTMGKSDAIAVLQWMGGQWSVVETIGMLSGIEVRPRGMPKEPGKYEGERILVRWRRPGFETS